MRHGRRAPLSLADRRKKVERNRRRGRVARRPGVGKWAPVRVAKRLRPRGRPRQTLFSYARNDLESDPVWLAQALRKCGGGRKLRRPIARRRKRERAARSLNRKVKRTGR